MARKKGWAAKKEKASARERTLPAQEPRTISSQEKKALLALQQNEITAHHVYLGLSRAADEENRDVLEKIAADELSHYAFWKSHTGQDVSPDKGVIRRFSILSRVFGITFTIKVLERGEADDQEAYGKLKYPGLARIISDEQRHEDLLIKMVKEEKLEYVGSMVLGLNDALVELTGTLAGLTIAFHNTRLVGISGLITGIAASLSMMSSEYLSKRADSQGKNPLKASMYTGIAYVITVFLLVSPFFIFKNIFHSLGVTVAVAIGIIAFFTYFSSVIREELFRKKFAEMAVISLGVALVSFLIGLAISKVLHILV